MGHLDFCLYKTVILSIVLYTCKISVALREE
jgi:hypothetical protein